MNIFVGDCLEIMRTMEDDSVDLVIASAIARGLATYESAMESEGIPEIIKSAKSRISLAEDARQRITGVPMDTDKMKRSTTTDGQPPEPGYENAAAPKPIDPRTGQHGAYYVLSAEERTKGFVRPVREILISKSNQGE